MAEIDTTIRGISVTVFGSNYSEDSSVGIQFGPEDVWAETEDGQYFKLTDDEENDFYGQLADIEAERLEHFDESQHNA